MQIKNTEKERNQVNLVFSHKFHLQLLRSLFQQSVCGFALLDCLIQLIHFAALLLHLSSQLISLQDQILQLHLSCTSLLLCFDLLLTQQGVALGDGIE